MADTIGDMIDKLTIANIRVWHIEDERRECTDGEKLKELTTKTTNANRERNNLIDQINGGLAVLVDSKNNIDSSFQLTAEDLLGVGKNKFYKNEDYNIGEITEELKGWDNSEYFGQWKTDEVIETYFPHKEIGDCVEVGAANGVKGSNTLYFERKGWHCLCIEPNPKQYESIMKHRKDWFFSACSAIESKLPLTVYDIGENNIMSSVTSLNPDKRLVKDHKDIINNSYTVEVDVKTLTHVLETMNWPSNIDFISIDTEGTELDVLRGFDFDKFDVQLFVIENNYNDPEIETYMYGHGYVKDQRYKINDFYIRGL